MGTFDIRPDAPGLLRAESLNTVISFAKTGTTSGRVFWNIPSPAPGCTSANQAYNGIVVVVSSVQPSPQDRPQDGVVYAADNTTSADLHSGDKISSAFVVGAFYGDRTTTFCDIIDLQPDVVYFVSGYPVDAELRYFGEGIHAFSPTASGMSTADTHGTHQIGINVGAGGVSGADATPFVTGQSYSFTAAIGILPTLKTPVKAGDILPSTTKTITINGTNAATYGALVSEINKQFALIDAPFQGSTAPYTNSLVYNPARKKVQSWTGMDYTDVNVDHVVAPAHPLDEGTPAHYVTAAGLWFLHTTPITPIVRDTDPTQLTPGVTVWYRPTDTTAFVWNSVVWDSVGCYIQASDPSNSLAVSTGTYWYNRSNQTLYQWNSVLQMWSSVPYVFGQFGIFHTIPTGTVWVNSSNNIIYVRNVGTNAWIQHPNFSVSEIAPALPGLDKVWYKPSTRQLYSAFNNAGTTDWSLASSITSLVDPTDKALVRAWIDNTSFDISLYDTSSSTWMSVPVQFNQTADPAIAPRITQNTLWIDTTTNTKRVWNVDRFVIATDVLESSTDPHTVAAGTYWIGAGVLRRNATTGWDVVPYAFAENSPLLYAATPVTGMMWVDTTTSFVWTWNGVAWSQVVLSPPVSYTKGTLWYDSAALSLKSWTGTTWTTIQPKATLELNVNGYFSFTDTSVGGTSYIGVGDVSLFSVLPSVVIYYPFPGVDGNPATPLYQTQDIGTDGSIEERLRLMNDIRYELGYPVMDVELTNEQLDFAITRALEELRSRSAVAYKHGYFFLNIIPETQRYYLTDKTTGMNKIVNVLGCYRVTSSFLSSAHGAGVYGQVVLQHLYNVGTFDLLSYHLMAEYTELMEILFAARLTFSWHENSRELWINHRFPFGEKMVLVEAAVERTEQDLITDRACRPWLRRFATAKSREILAEIRGKFASLPGAGGNVTMNATDLRMRAKEEYDQCAKELDTFVIDKPEEFGLGSTIVIG